MSKFQTAETFYRIDQGHPMGQFLAGRSIAEWAPIVYWPKDRPYPASQEIAEGVQILVHFSDGRWVASCPFCESAQVASESDPRFLCPRCLNAEAGGRWLRLVWPEPQHRAQIEALMEQLPRRHQYMPPGVATAAAARSWLRGKGVAV